jgi:uncharacterized membrane protein YtjA (UPF0391 family)
MRSQIFPNGAGFGISLTMLNYPAIFFLIALGAGGMGFTGIATSGVETVQALFVIFLIGAIISLPTRNKMQD